jgi:hypothetical protein
MWLMLAEVVQMEVWRKSGYEKEYIWEYKVPWYITQEEKELMGLFRKD